VKSRNENFGKKLMFTSVFLFAIQVGLTVHVFSLYLSLSLPGPINLGTTHQMCKQLHRLLTCTPLDQKIVYYTTDRPEDISNSMFLLGAFLCINLGVTPEKAWQPFAGLDAVLSLPFRDATWAKSSFDLHVQV